MPTVLTYLIEINANRIDCSIERERRFVVAAYRGAEIRADVHGLEIVNAQACNLCFSRRLSVNRYKR